MLKRIVLAAMTPCMFALAAPAAAQTAGGPRISACGAYDYTVFDPQRESSSTVPVSASCARTVLNRQSLVHSIFVIPHVVANSFGMGPDEVEPAGLGNLSPAEFGQRLESSSAIIISPVADAAPAAAPAVNWNIWGDVKYTWNDNGPAASDLDGPAWNVLTGLDYKLTSKITFGVIGSFEASDLDGPLVTMDSSGWGAGPYIGIVLTDNIVFSANLIGSRLQSSLLGGAVEFESDRLQAAASLNGYWYKNTWRFTPGASLSWSKEWQEETSGLALPDQVISTGMLTPSMQVGNTLRLSETTTMEPWAGAALDYVFLNQVKTVGVGSTNDPYADLRVQAGLNFGFGNNAQLAITGELGGLTQDQLDTYSIEANFSYQF